MKAISNNIAAIIALFICLLLLLIEPLIFKPYNLVNISKQAALIAIFAIAQSIVLITRGLDLSQGGVITIVSVSVAALCIKLGLPLSILIGLAIGLVCGCINGIIISTLNVSSFVVTLGTGFFFQGIALVVSNGQPIFEVTPNFSYIGWGELWNIPIIVYIVTALFTIAGWALNKITFARYFYAIGSNETASTLSGINVFKVKTTAYIFSGIITALGAVILASRINGGHPVEGINTPLQSVAASVIGGVSLFGGKGSVVGILLGSVFLAFISNSLSIMNISSYYQQIAIGIIIVLAIIIDKLSSSINLNNKP
jgi:ribose/xylose/arabinose/galactoside ABC-type transport system permease subunit